MLISSGATPESCMPRKSPRIGSLRRDAVSAIHEHHRRGAIGELRASPP